MTDPTPDSPSAAAPITGQPAISYRGISLRLLRLDGGTQCRAAMDNDHIAHLVEVLETGNSLPAAIVFHDGINYWLADGFHRYHAAQMREVPELWCEVRSGTQLDAVSYAVGANTTHGLRRTNADKRRAVEVALKAWPGDSSNSIAQRCGVSAQFVINVRNPVPANPEQGLPPISERAPENKYGAPHEPGDPALIERDTPQNSNVEKYDGPATGDVVDRLAREDRIAKLPTLIGRAREVIKAMRAIDKPWIAWLIATLLKDADFASPRVIKADAAARQGVRLPSEIAELDHDWHSTLGLTTLGNLDLVAVLRTYLDSRLVRIDEVIRERGSAGHAGDLLRWILEIDCLGFLEETADGKRRLKRQAEEELRS